MMVAAHAGETCRICDQSFPLAKLRAHDRLRPDPHDTIAASAPGWAVWDVICGDALRRMRPHHGDKIVRNERGAPSALDRDGNVSLTAVRGPVIMISQRRQVNRNRLLPESDDCINLKAALEFRQLHEKIDNPRACQWARLAKLRQIRIDPQEDAVNANRSP